jgi:Ca2+-dependent lipid-binding protein
MSVHFRKRELDETLWIWLTYYRPEDEVIMDWALSFTPNDLQDITPRQAARRVNPKIVLSIRVGKGAISKALPILLEDMSFSGKMRCVFHNSTLP